MLNDLDTHRRRLQAGSGNAAPTEADFAAWLRTQTTPA